MTKKQKPKKYYLGSERRDRRYLGKKGQKTEREKVIQSGRY